MEWAILFFIVIASSVFIPNKLAEKLINLRIFNWAEKKTETSANESVREKNIVNKV